VTGSHEVSRKYTDGVSGSPSYGLVFAEEAIAEGLLADDESVPEDEGRVVYVGL